MLALYARAIDECVLLVRYTHEHTVCVSCLHMNLGFGCKLGNLLLDLIYDILRRKVCLSTLS